MADYIIITSPDCSWCTKAKEALVEHEQTYVEFSTTESAIRHLFFSLDLKTVPQVFRSASGNQPVEYVGGYESLKLRLDYDTMARHFNRQ
jgi:glutaredoxin